MKIKCLALMLFCNLIISLYCKSQNDDNIYKYQLVYSYLLKDDYLKEMFYIRDIDNIYVYDSIVYLYKNNFFDLLKVEEKIQKRDEQKFLSVLDSLDEKNYFQSYYFKYKSLINNYSNRNNLILVFSRPIDNYLIVEVFKNYKLAQNLSDMLTFNKSILYLFYFNEDKITKVLKTKVIYN